MSMNPNAGADRMGTMPVGRLLISMAVPMMFSMMVTALYNVVDSIFVARLSEDALTAVSLAFPVQNMMIAIAVGIGIGASALISRMLGMGEREKANHFAMQGYLLSAISAFIFVIVGLFLAEPFATTQVDMSAPNGAAIRDDCAVYLRIVCAGGAGLFFTCLEEKLFAAVGKTMYTMLLQLSGAIINIILDPIMIFGLFGCPAF
ncbi:MAG: MATE family efflux transporter, partial [Peptococcaceae bacterium]|nr:MATE family efflux transporter [Peptococcaceae bacterium]